MLVITSQAYLPEPRATEMRELILTGQPLIEPHHEWEYAKNIDFFKFIYYLYGKYGENYFN